ncbi:MAG: electron transfer flavoprotein subunit beta/FixA family protein [Chloroflexota bacterium]|nr:electron transfer flavoprotein subunit beta/FixA family protein [Chloroflexota bacterium]
MRIIVPIRQILDPRGFTVSRRHERIFVNREEYIVNPNDKNALEVALRIKDAGDAQVIAVAVGKPRVDDALREAMAMGADAAYLLTDEALAQTDASGATKVLAKAIEKIGDFDLIVTGQETLDSGDAQLGPWLAGYFGIAQVTGVREATVGDSMLKAKRNWGAGYAEVEVALPTLLVVTPEANKPRYPHGGRIMAAYREWEVTTWSAEDLGLEVAGLEPLTERRGRTFPPERTLGERLTGSPQDVAADLIQQLRIQRVIK